MERKKNFCSCRLAAQETGRVRWCFGSDERKWQTRLKRLVFVPVFLLPLVVCSVLLIRYIGEGVHASPEPPKGLYGNRTANATAFNLGRLKRDFRLLFDRNSTEDYVIDGHNETDIYEYIINSDSAKQEITEFTLNKTPIIMEQNNFFWKNNLSYSDVRTLQGLIMKRYMNESVDPCNDFYEFACGNWKKHHNVPPDKTSYDTFEMLRENLDVILKDLLSDTKEDDVVNSTIDATIKAKLFYKSCMDEERLEHRGPQPLQQLLEELGGWPVVAPNWSEDGFEVEGLMAHLKLFNNDILIGEWVGPDIINSSNKYIIQIDQTSLGLPGRNYFLDPLYRKYLTAYQEFILSVVTILGAYPTQAEQEVDEIIKFETKIASIMASSENRLNVSDIYLKTNIGALCNYFPEFGWIKYFTIVLGRDVNLDEQIACYCMDYLRKLMVVLKDTRPRIISNYLLWRFVRHRTNNLDHRFLAAKQHFYHILFGREQSPARWQFCVSQVNLNMGMALGSLFITKYFDEHSKNDTLEMTIRLQEAFRIILKENKWLGETTKDYARMKIDKMNLKIGYPDFLLNKRELDKSYMDVEIHAGYFFENAVAILRHLTNAEQRRIGTGVNKTVWATAPAVVNAYYSRNKNQIIFPAGILQPPFYHKYFPKSLNFGGIGVVIGHEITHGFDDKGRLFDQHGNLQQWWREESIYKFHQRAKCMIEQYNSYIIPDMDTYMDGFITQGENIADNGGLKQAFRAYEIWLQDNPHADETLPGLNLTGKQLFFLNFAQVWCGKQRTDTVKSRLKVAVHSPGIFRVIGTLSNSEYFAQVYSCPTNSLMNPSEKCSLW